MKRNIMNIGGMIASGFLCFVLLGVPFPSDAGEVQLDPIMYALAEPPENPTALDIIKKNWCLFHIQMADTYLYRKVPYKGFYFDSYTTRLNKRGQLRGGAAERAIRMLHGENGIDFKDHIIYQSPEDVRGKALLIWSYIDKDREEDTWLWLPSLRKIRRVPGPQKEDYHFGTDLSYADLSLRVPSDEDHKIIDGIKVDENFIKLAKEKGAIPRVMNWWKETVLGEELWVIENRQLKGYITYETRVSYIIKTGKEKYHDILNLYYDSKGRFAKIIDRHWAEDPDHPGWYAEGLWHLKSTATGHQSFFDVSPPVFNIPIPDVELTQSILSKEKTNITPEYIRKHLGYDYQAKAFVPWVKYGFPWEWEIGDKEP